MVKTSTKLKGGSLVEVLVALSLISMLFVVGAGLWSQLDNYSSPDRLLRYRLRCRQMLSEAEQTASFPQAESEMDGILYRTESSLLGEQLMLLTVRAYSPSETLLLERSKIVTLDEN